MHRRLAVPLSAALVLAAAPHADAAPAEREPASIAVETMGNGHGKGLSQYGARNRAEDGQTYREIVEHYYPNTGWGTAGGTIRVLITGDTTDDVVVDARRGLKARSLGGDRTWTLPAKRDRKVVQRWRITSSGSESVVSYRPVGGSWKTWRTAAGDAEFTAGGGPMTLATPAGAVQYRGRLRSATAGAERNTVNVAGLDVYVRGVISREVFASWRPAALESQAVAARTYAVFERGNVPAGRSYDLCDTASCQVYGGVAAETSTTDAAVAATAGEIVTYDGEPAFAQFSASNGGWSVDGGYPYLVAEEDPYDEGVRGEDPTTKTFTGDQVTRHWTGLGDLVSVEVLSRDGRGPYGGRATQIRVTGTDSSVTVSGDRFRSFLGLRSTLLEITNL